MKVKIQKATAKDAPKVLELVNELRTSAYAEMGVKDVKLKKGKQILTFCQEVIARPDVLCLFARVGDDVVGMAMAYFVPKIADNGYRMVIEEMVVRKKYRNKKIGTKLMQQLEKRAEDKGVTVIKVSSGTKLKANKFYRKLGYTHFENTYRKKLT